MDGLKRLIREVHRRSLWQVLGIYGLGSWAVLQVVDVLADNMGLPQWTFPFAIVLLLLGLPVVLATAFVQEGIGARDATADDDVAARTSPVSTRASAPDREPAATHSILTWRNALIGGAAAALLWAGVAVGWFLFGRDAGATSVAGADAVPSAPASEDRRSIAVLPFANRSVGEEGEFFTAGMHDDILTELAKIPGLKVISRTSVLQYRDTEKDMQEIGEELGVSTVMEGAVERAGARVRITVQLIDAATDAHLWADSYDEELTADNVFAIRSDVAEKIASELKATLTPELRARIEARPTESLEAYDLVARGRHLVSSRAWAREAVDTAAALFRRAIAADSTYAPAWAAQAQAYYLLWNAGHLREEVALPVAWAAVDRALALDSTLAQAHAMRGMLLRIERRYDEAERALRRAVDLNPGSAEAHQSYSGILLQFGRVDEAVAEARRAVELDPLSSASRLSLLSRLIFGRRYDEAVEEARVLRELSPGEAYAHYFAGFAWTMKGEHARAIEEYGNAVELRPADPYLPPGLAFAYARAGDRARALAVLAAADSIGVPLKEKAIVYAALGELDTAFEYLEQAFDKERASLHYLETDPSTDPLHADPRWDDLLRRLRRD